MEGDVSTKFWASTNSQVSAVHPTFVIEIAISTLDVFIFPLFHCLVTFLRTIHLTKNASQTFYHVDFAKISHSVSLQNVPFTKQATLNNQ